MISGRFPHDKTELSQCLGFPGTIWIFLGQWISSWWPKRWNPRCLLLAGYRPPNSPHISSNLPLISPQYALVITISGVEASRINHQLSIKPPYIQVTSTLCCFKKSRSQWWRGWLDHGPPKLWTLVDIPEVVTVGQVNLDVKQIQTTKTLWWYTP